MRQKTKMSGDVTKKQFLKNQSQQLKDYRGEKLVHDKYLHSELNRLADEQDAFGFTHHGNYHSWHEGLAVVEEEVWEAELEMKRLQSSIELLRLGVYTNWRNINCDTPSKSVDAVIENALNLAHEAIQVAATAKRFLSETGVQSCLE